MRCAAESIDAALEERLVLCSKDHPRIIFTLLFAAGLHPLAINMQSVKVAADYERN